MPCFFSSCFDKLEIQSLCIQIYSKKSLNPLDKRPRVNNDEELSYPVQNGTFFFKSSYLRFPKILRSLVFLGKELRHEYLSFQSQTLLFFQILGQNLHVEQFQIYECPNTNLIHLHEYRNLPF